MSNINVYTLSTIGATNMIVRDAKTIALYSDNVNVYPDTVALFTTGTSMTPPPLVEPPLLGWNYRGCYTDSVSARTLGNIVQVPGGAAGMSIEACITVCQSGGWPLAGVEYSGECCKSSHFASCEKINLNFVLIDE